MDIIDISNSSDVLLLSLPVVPTMNDMITNFRYLSCIMIDSK